MAKPKKEKDPVEAEVDSGTSYNPVGGGGYGTTAGADVRDVLGQRLDVGTRRILEQTLGPIGGMAPPIYFAGDEWNPASGSPEDILQLQKAMKAAGYLTAGSVPGIWGQSTANDFARLLAEANAQTKTWEQVLAETLAAGEDPFDEDKGRAPLVTRATNPDDLKYAARRVSRDLIGRSFNEEEMQRFISAYQAAETGVQTQAYAMTGEGATGGAVTSVAEPAPAAEAFARENFGAEVAATDWGTRANQLAEMIRSHTPGIGQ